MAPVEPRPRARPVVISSKLIVYLFITWHWSKASNMEEGFPIPYKSTYGTTLLEGVIGPFLIG